MYTVFLKGEVMTENRNSKTLKSRIIIILTVLCLIMTSCFFVAACGGSSENKDDTTNYSYTEKDTETISNSDFVYGTYNLSVSKYPVTTVTGWSRAVDNSASSSTVNSGVIDVSETAFPTLLSTLYADSDFLNVIKNKYDFTTDDVKTAIKADKGDDYAPTDSEVKDYILEHYVTPNFLNPGTHEGAEDNMVYMMNNYAKNEYYKFGTAQRITSSSTVTVQKGEVYKISVWVKTQFLTKGGANIRITNSIDGHSQAQFKISNITDTEWTNYTVYFKADDNYSSTFTVVLGLGYGNGSSTEGVDFAEGTAFFDSITVEKVEDYAAETAGKNVTDTETYTIGSKVSPEYVLDGEQSERYVYYLYDMSLAEGAADYFTAIPLPTDFSYTESNNTPAITSKTMVGDESTISQESDGESLTLNVNSASGTLKIQSDEFTLDAKEYVLVNFLLSNRLNAFGSTAVTVDLFDVAAETVEKRAAIASFDDVNDDGDFTTVSILVKNNFESGERSFYLELIVGPTDVKSVAYKQNFATGSVIIKDLGYAKGSLTQDKTDPDAEIYSFFSSEANATQSLYAGYSSDYQQQSDSASYNLSPASGDVGVITYAPSPVKDYFGIVSNHTYIKEETEGSNLETAVNTRTTFGGAYGYAGLINTKYLSDYGDAALSEKLGVAATGDYIQPIVINNATLDHYGFVGETRTVSSSSYAKVSVEVRVVDDAKAYIYLVDTSLANKEVIEFADFTSDGKTINAADHKLQIVLSKEDMTNAVDGFVTVNFYVATGANSKSFRVEIWNGGRDGKDDTASQGYVFVKSVNISTSSAFSEPDSIGSTFSKSGNPLYEIGRENLTLLTYTRKLTDLETKFNAEYPDKAIEYLPKYIWAESNTDIYAIYNTVDPVTTNPYDDIIDDDTTGGGCTANTDSANFWMSFSSILLAVAIVVALIALIVKNVRRKRIANRSDAKSHYKVSSRTSAQKAIKAEKEKMKKASEEDAETQNEENTEVSEEEPKDEITENTEEISENSEETKEETPDLDTYVYGDVQDFGEELTTNEEQPKDEDDKTE